jgi:hypothetical protein
MKTYLWNDTPIVAYNADKQELIGIFFNGVYVRRYFYQNNPTLKLTKDISSFVMRKGKLKDTSFDFFVALRFANKEQIEMLGDKDYVILNSYPIPISSTMKGFEDTAASLTKYLNYKRSIKFTELKRIKNEKL